MKYLRCIVGYDTDHRKDCLSSVRGSLELIKRMMFANQLAFEELFLEVLAWRAVLAAQTLGVAFRPWSDGDQLTLAIERAHLHQADGLAAQLVAMKQ